MRKLLWILQVLALCMLLAACNSDIVPESSSTAPVQTFSPEEIHAGWQTINGNRYCFSPDGQPLTGWITDGASRYYLDASGMALTGWQEVDGKQFCFGDNGAMTVGWAQLDEGTYYFGIDGSLFKGLLNISGKGYYFTEDGRMYSGWLEKDGNTYYFGEDGVMAVGPVEIDGVLHHFSPHGVKILLVNPWNTVPADYQVELEFVTDQYRLAVICAESLNRMLSDCAEAGYEAEVCSAFRTHEDQVYLFNRKVNSYLSMGWTQEKAQTEAAKEVAMPDTSEHQLGLAVDIIDVNYPYLDEHQANLPAQKWLMEHCHEYGFILRYPIGATQITGIIFEPWHYRYVGVEIAQEIMNLGITLEEYLGAA